MPYTKLDLVELASMMLDQSPFDNTTTPKRSEFIAAFNMVQIQIARTLPEEHLANLVQSSAVTVTNEIGTISECARVLGLTFTRASDNEVFGAEFMPVYQFMLSRGVASDIRPIWTIAPLAGGATAPVDVSIQVAPASSDGTWNSSYIQLPYAVTDGSTAYLGADTIGENLIDYAMDLAIQRILLKENEEVLMQLTKQVADEKTMMTLQNPYGPRPSHGASV